MNAWWTHFRRLVASVMLVAVASLVFHSGAMGFHQHGSSLAECGTTASSGHVHKLSMQSHGEPVIHQHAGSDHTRDDVPGDGSTDGRHAATPDTCCASVCAIALTAIVSDGLSAPLDVMRELPSVSQDGVSAHLDGLKRPPRTPGIA